MVLSVAVIVMETTQEGHFLLPILAATSVANCVAVALLRGSHARTVRSAPPNAISGVPRRTDRQYTALLPPAL